MAAVKVEVKVTLYGLALGIMVARFFEMLDFWPWQCEAAGHSVMFARIECAGRTSWHWLGKQQ